MTSGKRINSLNSLYLKYLLPGLWTHKACGQGNPESNQTPLSPFKQKKFLMKELRPGKEVETRSPDSCPRGWFS